LQVVFLQFALRNRPHRIVPILCPGWGTREDREKLNAFADTLRDMINERGPGVAVIAGADLAHVGARFGDRNPLTDAYLDKIRRQDLNTLDTVLARDADAFAEDVQEGGNPRRICGLSAIYLLLKTLRSDAAETLCYDQAVDIPTQTCVTFAGVAFYAQE
jgi:AmmeMemoRadiSam system protein B